MKKNWRKRRYGESKPARDLVSAFLANVGLLEELRRERLFVHWEEIAGRRLAARAWPESLRSGVLRVRVANSAWLHELSFLKHELGARLNRAVGDPPLVEEIALTLGTGRPRSGADQRQQHRLPPGHKGRRTPAVPEALARPGDDCAGANVEVAAVEDPELRAIIAATRRRLNL